MTACKKFIHFDDIMDEPCLACGYMYDEHEKEE